MRYVILVIAAVLAHTSNACDMPLKPGWKIISVEYLSVCNTAKCSEYKKNDPHSIRINEKVCVANVIVDGVQDTAAIFGQECDRLPEKFKALTLPFRCYKDLPAIVEMPNHTAHSSRSLTLTGTISTKHE